MHLFQGRVYSEAGIDRTLPDLAYHPNLLLVSTNDTTTCVQKLSSCDYDGSKYGEVSAMKRIDSHSAEGLLHLKDSLEIFFVGIL